MAEHGGYRKPTNPAPVSGPGKYSRRTDGQPSMQLSNAAYGEQQQFQDIQSGAKISNSGVNPTPGPQGSGPASPIVGMGAPSQQPDVPVTAGAAMGPGPGLEALGQVVPPDRQDAEYLRKYLPTLVMMAERDDTPPSMKTWVRTIVANL